MAYDSGTDQLTISYNVASGDNPVGIALRLNVDAVEGSADVTSTGSSGAEVVSATGGSEFQIYLDYAWNEEDSGDGYQLNEGHPLAKWIVEPGVDKGLPTLPAAKVALCMGHLRESESDPDYSGPASDTIAVVQLNAAGDDTAVVLDVDDDRGGVVGSPLTTNLPIEISTGAIECFNEGWTDSGGQVVIAADVTRYNALPQYAKDCWCYTCFGSGDANGDCIITTGDLYILIDISTNTFFTPYAGNECADLNYDGILSTGDLYKMIDISTNTFYVCPIPQPPCVPVTP
jgi:predicted nucleic-acid-binding Zn-ribbon protein